MDPILVAFWENVTFCLCIYVIKPLNRVILKWINTLVNLNEVEIFPFFNPYLPEFSDPLIPENVRSHPSNSNENTTPL